MPWCWPRLSLACGEADHRPSAKSNNLIMTSETADLKNGCNDDLDADNFSSGSIANPANTDETKMLTCLQSCLDLSSIGLANVRVKIHFLYQTCENVAVVVSKVKC